MNIFFILIAIAFSYYIISKTTKNKIIEKESFLWLLISLGILVLSLFPRLIILLANFVGVEYAPSLLFLLCTILVLYVSFRHSQKISELDQKVKELAQRNAILENKINQ